MTQLMVTGTQTGVGKTIDTAALAALAHADGRRVAVVEPVHTGDAPNEPGDLEDVRQLPGGQDLHELARFEDPLGPATAARRAHLKPPSALAPADAIERVSDRDLVPIERAGGLLVHLDLEEGMSAVLAAALRAPTIVVARAGLNALNAGALTCESLSVGGVDCLGLAIGAWPFDPDLAASSKLDDLLPYTGRPLLGSLPEGAGEFGRAEFLEAARANLGPVQLGERLVAR